MIARPAAVDRKPAPARSADDQPLTSREQALARNHAAVIDRLQREGIPIPPPPDRGAIRTPA